MSEAIEFVSSIADFYRQSSVEQLLALAWFVEVRQQRPSFDGKCLRECFREIGADPPDMSVYLPRLANKKPPQVIKIGPAYRLAGATRRELEKRYDREPTIANIAKTLSDLPSKVPDIAERIFLVEAISCYKVRAFRAAIIMTWNLAYDHLMVWLLLDTTRLDRLNSGLANKYPKKNVVIAKREDFGELRESEVIEALRVSRLLDKDTCQILREKLDRRNMAAHPSRVIVTQHQADDMISDLVANVILQLA